MSLPELSGATWLLLGLAAVMIGFAKTAIGGVGSIAVAFFAVLLPARESTGAILPLLIVGDVVAVTIYRQHTSWGTLWRLVPGVVPGIVLGAWYVGQVDDNTMRRSIGAILVIMTGVATLQRWQSPWTAEAPRQRQRPHRALSLWMGVASGFATMTANAAGPIMTLYLILSGLPMLEMLGTGAWFFLVVNIAKLPFSAGLDLITPSSLAMDAALVPALLLGAWLGVVVIRRIDQRRFELAALVLSGLGAVLLLL
jgi:uncharacterized membrane protein YfcA